MRLSAAPAVCRLIDRSFVTTRRLFGRDRRRALALSAFGAVALLAACGSPSGGRPGDPDYRGNTPLPARKPLDVPPDLAPLPQEGRFTLPDPATASARAAADARPGTDAAVAKTPVIVVPKASNVRIERDGALRWLVVDVPPEAAVPVIKDVFNSIGLVVEREDLALGVLETGWAENRAKLPQDFIRRSIGRVLDGLYSTGELDRYKASIERTPQNTTSIFITHTGMVEVYTSTSKDQTVWQRRPPAPDLELDMLQRLAVRFAPAGAPAAAPTTVAATPAAGGTPKAEPKPVVASFARVVRGADGRASAVQIDEPFDRAWRRVGLALDRGGFTVEDRDRTKGFYFVRYLDPDYEAKIRREQGFFNRLFGSDPKIAAQQFRIVVADNGTQTAVSVQDKEGKPDPGTTAERILGLIGEQIR